MLKASQVKDAIRIAEPFSVRRRNQAGNGWVDGTAVAYDEIRDVFIVDHGAYGVAAVYSCDIEIG